MALTVEFQELLLDTSIKHPRDLILREVSQKVYEEAYEFLTKKYGGAMGRTNLMLNGHLITPKIEQAMATRERVVADQNIAKQLEQKP